MTRATIIVLTLAAGVVATVYGQRVNSPEEYRHAMRTIDASVSAARKAIAAADFAEAKPPLVLARQSLAGSAPFWAQKKIDAAVKLTREAVNTLDDLDNALSAATVDPAAVNKGLASLGETCAACHAAHREGDTKSGYRIKNSH
jgi:hypothetical protein